MRALSASELLAVWEQGTVQGHAQRALTLLAAACPETAPDDLAQLSIGRRDARLLMLREWAFGPHLVGLATCPECGERLELTFDVADIRAGTPDEPSPSAGNSGEGRKGDGGLSLDVAEYEVHFRLPNSQDLVAIASPADVTAARHRLLQRCLLAVHRDGAEMELDQLPAEVIHAVEQRMAEADPQADVRLLLDCPACNHQWQAVFDIVSYFWSEIDAWAHRTLREVHILASTYGWHEASILAMSPWRRQYYLAMITGS